MSADKSRESNSSKKIVTSVVHLGKVYYHTSEVDEPAGSPAQAQQLPKKILRVSALSKQKSKAKAKDTARSTKFNDNSYSDDLERRGSRQVRHGGREEQEEEEKSDDENVYE